MNIEDTIKRILGEQQFQIAALIAQLEATRKELADIKAEQATPGASQAPVVKPPVKQ